MSAVAVFSSQDVQGSVVVTKYKQGVHIVAEFDKIPPGKHGFHIHDAGDLREPGCVGACSHFHVGPMQNHGDKPGTLGPRHTGDLGNISPAQMRYTYNLTNVKLEDLYGRSAIVHADEDDLGLGEFPDSHTTGHSGSRIACAIFGRAKTCSLKRKGTTRKIHR